MPSIDARLLRADDQTSLPDIAVIAFCRRLTGDRPLGEARSNADGFFSIDVDERTFKRITAGRLDVDFTFATADGIRLEPFGSAVWNAAAAEAGLVTINLTVPVPEPRPEPGGFSVSGTVTLDTGVAWANAAVEALDHTLGKTRSLGSTATDADGRYRIEYALRAKQAADLQVRVGNAAGEPIAASRIHYQTQPHASIDISVPSGKADRPAEFARLAADVHGAVDADLAQLDAAGVAYLAGRTGWDARAVAMASRAALLSQQTRIPAQHYYALLRAGLPDDPALLHLHSDAELAVTLKAAAASGLIDDAASIDATIELHRAAALSTLAQHVPTGAASSLGDMLALRLDDAGRQRFLSAYRDTGGAPEQLWQRLRDDGFDDTTIDRLQTDGALGAITSHNAPVVGRLAQQIGSTADLAGKGFYEAVAWDGVIGNDVPAGVTKQQYAQAMALQVQITQPTLVTAARVAKGELTDAAVAGDLAAFLSSNGPAALGATPVQQWLGYDGLSPTLQHEAKRVERLYQISPSDAAMVQLADLGLDSAKSVMAHDSEEFVRQFGDRLGESTARAVHTKAREVHAATINLATAYLLQHTAPEVHALASPQQVAMSATLEELLGSLDFCTCEECKSVLSPAAYLVELLEFLDNGPAPTPLQTLLSRRPDLDDLLLSCENTNTRLPYVDLVNEILEHWIVNGNLVGFQGHNTEEAAADLLADPAYVLGAAYTDTAGRVWPVPLPFDMPLAHLRAMFASWDTSLADALAEFGAPADARRERLGLNARAWQLLTDRTSYDLAECYGEPPGADLTAISDGRTLSRRLGLQYTQLDALLKCRFVNPGAALLPRFETLGLTFAQVRANSLGALSAEDAQWVVDNAAALLDTLMLQGDLDAQPCDFSAVRLRTTEGTVPTELHWQRLHRFVRLWRTLGWPMDVADDALVALLGADPADVGDLDAAMTAMLDRLANMRALLHRRSATAKQLPQWLAALGSPDALAKLLRIGTTDLADLVQITGFDPTDLDGDDPELLRLERAVAAVKASPLKVADISYLLTHADPTGKLAPADLPRDLGTLREALNAVEAELAAATANPDLAGAAVRASVLFDADTVAAFFGLVQGTTTYRAPLATTVANLPLAHAALAFDSFAGQLTHAGVLDEATRASLAAAADGLQLADVPELTSAGELAAYVIALKAALQQLRDDAAADIAALAPELGTLYGEVATLLDATAKARAILVGMLPGLRSSARTDAILAALGPVLKIDADAVAALALDPAVLATGAEPVIADLLALDTPVVLDSDTAFSLAAPATDDYVLILAAAPGTTVSLTVDGTAVIATTALGPTGEVRSSAVRLTGGALTPASVTLTGPAQLRWRTRAQAAQPVPASRLTSGAALTAADTALRRLLAAATLVRALGLAASDIAHLGGVEPVTKGLFAGLDIDGSVAGPDLHAQWARLAHVLWFVGLKSAVEPEPGALARALADPAGTLGPMLLQPAADIDAVLAHLGKTRADLGGLPVLRAVRDAGALADTALQPAADLIAWTRADPDGPHVRGIVDALRERMDAASWRDAMKAVADPLRDQRREALVADILHHHPPDPAFTSAEQLYEYFLVDVQMDACMETSRIRLALSSVQLFVMRCLLDLEPAVPASAIRADRWQWMKRYRIWEANRKIFLYPENWLEPELRDSKSPFFAELESDLLKADITDDLAEQAYLSYLQKLDEIARLDIVGAYLEERVTGDPDDDVLHVIGRSGGTKRQHWYRRYDQTWSAWEKVGLSIDSDLVFPVVWRQQLFVFWFTTLVKANQQPTGTGLQAIGAEAFSGRADVDVEITLHWGERYRGRWSTPKSTETRLPIRFAGLSSFDPSRLVISGRTFRPFREAPERLVLGVTYRQDGWFHAATVTFTTKHAPPHIEYGIPVKIAGRPYGIADGELADLDSRVRRMWSADASGTVLDTNAFMFAGRDLTAQIDQPTWSSQASRTQNVITKTSRLTPGLRVRPLQHPTVEPYEAPFFYADEHSVFNVGATEHITRERTWYYVPDFAPVIPEIKPDIPLLYEEPVIPPKVFDPRGPVTDLAGLDTYVNKVITTSKPFVFSGVPIDIAGPAGQGF
jgi:ABC toxin N-terminal region/Neuraminidase-like domain/Salmonella virulence plasmid 28.1kDa A protein